MVVEMIAAEIGKHRGGKLQGRYAVLYQTMGGDFHRYRFCTGFFEEKMPKARVIYPEGTYLLWVDFSAYFDDYKALEDLMLHKAKVALDEGYIFGDEGRLFERINVATPRSILEDCLTRIYKAGSWA